MDTSVIFSYLVRALVMLVAIPVHEFSHALMSHFMGDDTAKRMGRLSLNPLAHLDLMGVVCMIFVGVGWAKPVGIDAGRFKRPRLGMALTAFAGPLSNLIVAFISTIIYKALYYAPKFGNAQDVLLIIFETMIVMNIMLAVFNLIPIPPLDGSRIFLVWLPKNIYFGIMKYERYTMLVIFVMLMVGVLDMPLRIAQNYIISFMFNATSFVEKIFLASYI